MDRKIQTILGVFTVLTVGLVVVASNPGILHGTSEPWYADELDPLRFLKRFQDVREIGTGKKAGKTKTKKKFVPPAAPDSPVGPNIILAVDLSTRMQFDENGHYYDLGTWPRLEDPSVADSLGVAPGGTNYRRRYDNMVDRPGIADPFDFAVDADQITVWDDQDADYDDFFDPTRLSIARQGLAQAVEENDTIVRFGLMRTRYGDGAVLGGHGNEETAQLMTMPQSALPGDLGTQRWKVTIPWTTTYNDAASADGSEVLVAADLADASTSVMATLALEPDQAGALLPAGLGLNDSTDSPIAELLTDARAEAVRLMNDDLALYAACRNTAVVLVTGGSGDTDPAAVASTFAAVAGGGVTHRVPIIVVAIAPPPGDVATLQAIATNSGGAYFEATNALEVTYAVNHAVQTVHQLADDLDLGLTSTFVTTSPIVGTVDLSDASDIDGIPLINSVVTTLSGARIPQLGNVVVTAGFELPGFEADLRAFRTYRPVLDATKPLGYRFTSDGTALWRAHTPAVAGRNVYTYLPGTGMVRVSTAASTVSTLRPYLRMPNDTEASDLIDFILTQPLGAIVDSTPAIANPPSLPPPDTDYVTFATQRVDRRSMVYYGGNDGMVHAIDARTGVETWAFIPFNLLPKLQSLRDGQPVDDFTYFVDSSPKVSDVKVGGVWKTLLIIGQGMGGTFYQAFDVSDAGMGVAPDSDNENTIVNAFNNPSVIPLEWTFPRYSAFDHTIATPEMPFGDLGASATPIEKTVGHTWSDPAVGQIEDETGPYVVMTGSGFLDETIEAQGFRGGVRAGTTFYLLDAGTGAVHDSHDVGDVSGKTHFKNSLQADPTATGPQNSRFVNQVYIGDTEGSLWRFDLSNSSGTASMAVPVETYDAQEEHPFFASLALVNVGGPTRYLFMSTGVDIMPNRMKMEDFRMIGAKDDASKSKPSKKQFDFAMTRHSGTGGDERPTSAPAVAGDVVFYTTTTEYPNDPCRRCESALYALTYDGNVAYGNGTGGGAGGGAGSKKSKGKKGKVSKKAATEAITTWEGRSSSPFVADQHLYFTADDELRIFGDPDDFNNGVTAQGVRVTSWREQRP